MVKKQFVFLLLGFLLVLGACTSENNKEKTQKKADGKNEPNKYAELFSIRKVNGGKLITVNNPWTGEEQYANYFLVKHEALVPETIPNNALLIRTPVKNIIALSTTHVGPLHLLGLKNALVGLSDDKVYDAEVKLLLNHKAIKVVGDTYNLNKELVIDMNPDLIMASGMENVHDNVKQVARIGIPVIYNIEWMEKSPLGRAEWLKFIAAFFNEDQRADSIFSSIETKYLETAALLKPRKDNPTILMDKNWKGTWFMPGGGSYVAHLLKDAGGDFYYKDETKRGSVPLSFEAVLDKHANADIWFNPRAESLDLLLQEDERYGNFKAFKSGEVYQNTKRTLNNLANDYWESGLVSPHLLLSDMMKIIHPELLPNHTLVYYKKLQ